MYITEAFKEKDRARIIALANEFAFASLITINEGVPSASHLPLLIESGEKTIILGHMAKLNEQWKDLQEDNEVLVIFQGPHAYISPSIYEGFAVPTWNYTAIHMYGTAKVVKKTKLKKIINSLTDKYEKEQETPWNPEYPEKMLDAIVGFEIMVNRIEAKFKLSQNREEGDRKNIIINLNKSGTESEIALAKIMEENELQ